MIYFSGTNLFVCTNNWNGKLLGNIIDDSYFFQVL